MNENDVSVSAEAEKDSIKTANEKPQKDDSFRLFKNCSATLKRFSVLVFAINLFLTFVGAAIGIALIIIYLGTEMLTLLIVPIISVVIILVLFARFVSALVYGFAEIVKDHENNK